MRIYQIGNDVSVTLTLNPGESQQFSIEGKRMNVLMQSGPYKVKIDNVTVVDENTISFDIDRKLLYRPGIYKFIINTFDPLTGKDETFTAENVFQMVTFNPGGQQGGDISVDIDVESETMAGQGETSNPLKPIRIGSDVTIVMKVTADDPESFTLQGKEIRIVLVCGSYKKEIRDMRFFYPDSIEFTIDQRFLYRYGIYGFVLYVKTPTGQTDEMSFDVPNVFQIVTKNYPGAEEGHVTLNIGASIINPGGGGVNVHWGDEFTHEIDLTVHDITRRLLKTSAIATRDKQVDVVNDSEAVAMMKILGIYMEI